MSLAPPLQQIDRTYVLLGKLKLSYFGGCDYFRLSTDPRVLKALRSGLDRFGLTVAASRRTTGNHALYEKLEGALARFFQAGGATLLSNGYLTNLVVAQALAGTVTHVLVDERSHASVHDAAPLFACPIAKFEHRNPSDLGRKLKQCGPRSTPIVLTDGMFSHDGSAAPLSDYLELLPAHGWILVDDAHGAGILGSTGRGTPELAQTNRHRVIQTIALSKAFGAYGGAVLTTPQLKRRVQETSRIFNGTTPLPLPLAAAALESVRILGNNRALLRKLNENAHWLKCALRNGGLHLPSAPGPIVALHPRSPAHANAVRKHLLDARIFPPFIRYPGGPAEGYFRFAISSEHTPAQLENLASAILHTA